MMNRELIQICAWCPVERIRVLNRITLRPGEGLDFRLSEETGRPIGVSKVSVGSDEGVPLLLSHGICPECKAKLMADPAIKEARAKALMRMMQ